MGLHSHATTVTCHGMIGRGKRFTRSTFAVSSPIVGKPRPLLLLLLCHCAKSESNSPTHLCVHVCAFMYPNRV